MYIRGMQKTAVAYLRISTEDQHNGADAQRQAIEAWSSQQGVHIAHWSHDLGVSGAAPLEDRPGLMEALEALREHSSELLVCAKRDRLARDVGTAAAIERLVRESGAQIATADGLDAADTPEGQLIRCIIDAMAQYERALIRSRTKAALKAKKARGERTGSIPFGFCELKGKLAPLEHEQAAIARIRELRAQGVTLHGLVHELTSEGHAPRGAKWHVTTIVRILAAANSS